MSKTSVSGDSFSQLFTVAIQCAWLPYLGNLFQDNNYRIILYPTLSIADFVKSHFILAVSMLKLVFL